VTRNPRETSTTQDGAVRTHLTIDTDSPGRDDVRALLAEHLADMFATSPPESVHALDLDGLLAPGVTFVTARDAVGDLLGCGALAEAAPGLGELKSMRTARSARGRGVASAVLAHLLGVAVARGYGRVSLETGSQDFFAPARRLYARHGFAECGPFGGYALDPHSVFMTLALPAPVPAGRVGGGA
jgi:putative acetyltransferase